MQLTVKLFASLTDFLPPDARRRNQISLDVPDDATVAAVIESLMLPPRLVHLVLVNGVYVSPSERGTHRLVEGDVLAIWPPIAGG